MVRRHRSRRAPAAGTAARIEVENFDHGGEAIAYHDVESANLGGGNYRKPLGVDTQATSDAGGGFNVGWMRATEWLLYTVDVRASGRYRLDLRVASNGAGGTFHIEVGGVKPLPPELLARLNEILGEVAEDLRLG